MKRINVKRIETMYNPSAVAAGNDGCIVFVSDQYKHLYKKPAIYRISPKCAYIEATMRYFPRSNMQKYCIKIEWKYNGTDVKEKEVYAETYEDALYAMEKLIKNHLSTYRDRLERVMPQLYDKEGQISLF